jgi:prepilin-type N-terminal cleavage/methylation domain-containing protein
MKSSFVPRSRVASTRGMTLVEMMVALTVTLIMMGAVITVFGFIGETVTDSRSMIETNDRLRSAAHRLREDLGSVTATMMPPLRPESGSGYFEIIEGMERSYPTQNGSFASGNRDLITGDTDDGLFFTIRSGGEPFRGKFDNGFYESPMAEVAWYLRETPDQSPNTNPKTYVLCRKLMLIVSEVPGRPLDATFYDGLPNPSNPNDRHSGYDVSARRSANGTAVANTLGDLTKRENRFARINSFPYALDLSNTSPIRLFNIRAGEDVVLTNVLSMDVQVWDPQAPLKWLPNSSPPVILTPSDPVYRGATGYPTDTDPTRGAYVDLGLMSNVSGTTFMHMPNNKSGLKPPNVPYFTYDTWSFHYEHDGVRQPTAQFSQGVNTNTVDAGTNGIDDNSTVVASVGIDDISERETMPPYPLPLRGIRVTLRVYEPSSRQVREVTIVESFVPE